MTSVIAAIDNSPVAAPVAATAHRIAELYAARARALHVRENGVATARAAAAGAGLELEIVGGSPIDARRRGPRAGRARGGYRHPRDARRAPSGRIDGGRICRFGDDAGDRRSSRHREPRTHREHPRSARRDPCQRGPARRDDHAGAWLRGRGRRSARARGGTPPPIQRAPPTRGEGLRRGVRGAKLSAPHTNTSCRSSARPASISSPSAGVKSSPAGALPWFAKPCLAVACRILLVPVTRPVNGQGASA